MQPSDFRIARTATISAPAPMVFAQVNDFRKWQAWSPYEKLDPAMKRTYEGAAAGTGAISTWAGNNEVGEGRTTTFKPEGDRTAVTWSLAGKKNFTAKAVHLFMNMDRMVGGQFEEGLARMKSVVEAAAKQ